MHCALVLNRQDAKAAISNHCAVAQWCAANGPQVCCENLGKGHLLGGPLGDASPLCSTWCALPTDCMP